MAERNNNLEYNLQGFGDYFRGQTTPPSDVPNWAVQDWHDGFDAAKSGVDLARSKQDEIDATRRAAETAQESESEAKSAAVEAANRAARAEADAAAAVAAKDAEIAALKASHAAEIEALTPQEDTPTETPEEPEQEDGDAEPRSLLNRLTFGLLGN